MTPRSAALLPRLAPRLVPLVLVVLLGGLLAAVAMVDRHDGVRAWAFWEAGGQWDDGGLAVAREEVVNFFDLDHRRIDDDVAQVLSLATGDFAKEYAAKRKVLVATVKEKQVVWTASIPDGGAAVEYVDGDRAAVLVAVDVEKSLAGAPPAPERDRVRVVLRLVDDTWLVSDFREVG
ncbi:MAG TPA: hypothetical protein VNS81_09215 [Nocardioides sp.]|nr:hypothetical protein [Nocardioides sp.]